MVFKYIEGDEPILKKIRIEKSDDMTEKGYESLPENLRNYVHFIDDQVSCPVSIISIGPERSQTIIRWKLTFTKETLDFNGKTDPEIINILDEYNIPLAPEEIKTIQNDFLARAPSVAECVLFSIEGSEHC